MKLDWAENEDWFTMELEERIALVKSAVTMADVAELCGYEVDNDKIRPPWNEVERTPSTHIYDEHFYDYATGRHGDVFDFLHEVEAATGETPRPLPKLVNYLRDLALRGGKEPGDVEVVKVRQVEDLTQQMGPIDAVVCAGIDVSKFPVTIDQNGTFSVGHYEPHRVYGIKLRHPDGRKTSVPGSQFTHRLYSPVGWVGLHQGPTAVICEGESDSWAMWHQLDRLGVDVLALPSGASAWKDHWLEDLAPYSQVLLCFDNDRAGKQALDKVTRKIGFDRAKELRIPQLYNDVREAVTAGWRPTL